jgi:hypothetical protein
MKMKTEEKKKKSQEILIFLDMDDVITEWQSYADKTSPDIPQKDLIEHYHSFDEEWWASIPPCDGARDFYDALCALAPVRFLTGIKLNTGVYGGKARWIMNFIPEKGAEILRALMPMSSTDKHLLAKSGRILIDDRLVNIQAWQAAGGIGIHHTGDHADSLRRVNQAIRKFKEQEQCSKPNKRQKKYCP